MSKDRSQSAGRLEPLRRLTSKNVLKHAPSGRPVLWEVRSLLLWMLAASVWVLILSLATHPIAYGQSSTYARLVGTVKDQTGAVLPGVEVTSSAKATNVTSLVISNDRGDYLIDKLMPGAYDVTAELPGFKTQISPDVRLEVSQVLRMDLVLTPGEISERVTVTGQSTIIDTDAVEIGTVVEEKKILDLPLRGRSMTKLAYLTTGAVQPQQANPSEYVGTGIYGGGSPAFNGLYSHSNQLTLDGANNQNYINQRPAVQPTPETIQEFKVITNNYSAEYGRVGGAVISMLSKSGSNEFHGHGWYYIRDERFDAANFFTNKTGVEKLPVNYQIFGGSMGGPIIKDQTFFHAHYERFIDDLELTRFITVPSLAMRSGDLGGAGAHGQIPQLYNPFDVVGGERQPFEGNRIPLSLRSPIYQRVMELAPPPEPNVAGATSQNYSYPNTRNTRINKYSIRGDQHFSGGDTLFGRFSWQNTPETRHFGGIGLPGSELHGVLTGFSDGERGWQAAIGWVNPMGANLVTEFSASIWKARWLLSRPPQQTNFAEELGYDDAHRHPVFYADGSRGPGGMADISLEGYAGWRGQPVNDLADWGMRFKYTASWRRGSHYLKFGVEHTRNLDVNYHWIPAYSGGGDLFDGYATGQITRNEAGNINGATFGEPWADLMLGLPSGTRGNILGLGGFFGHFNQSHYSAFVNDEWKVGPNLTLNLGLRWEQPRPPHYEGSPDGNFATDYYYCNYDFSRANNRIDPVQMMPRGFDISQWQGETGLAVPFENLSRRGCYEARWRYFAPRFGLAWRMFGNNRTVLRFGAGLTYDQEFGVLRARVMRPALGAVNLSAQRGFETPSVFLGQRLELPTTVQQNEYQTCYFSENEWEEGQVYSYNLSIQHEIFQGTKLEVGYVGNQGRHIRAISPFNGALGTVNK